MCRVLRKLIELEGSDLEYDFMPANYPELMRHIKHFVSSFCKPEDKLRAYDYVIYMFRIEFAARTHTRLFRWKDPQPLDYLIPHYYYTEDGVRHDCVPADRKQIVLDEQVAVAAWRPGRLKRILPIISKQGFIEDSNHKADYYPELDLAVISSGNHSISAGIFSKSGSVHADVYNLADIFEHINVDGCEWFNRHTNEVIGKVVDVYIAVLYRVAQERYEYQKCLGLLTH